MTHHQQAIVTGFILANDVTPAQINDAQAIAEQAFRYCPIVALAATRRLREDSLVADWFKPEAQAKGQHNGEA